MNSKIPLLDGEDWLDNEVGIAREYWKVEVWSKETYKEIYEFNEDSSPKMIFMGGSCGIEDEIPEGSIEINEVKDDDGKVKWVNYRYPYHARHWETDKPTRKMGIILEGWINHNSTFIKQKITKNGKQVYFDDGWFKK